MCVKKRKKKRDKSIQDLWNNSRQSNIHTIGIPEGKDKQNGEEEMFEEIMAEKFQELMTNTKLQIQEIQDNNKDKYQITKSTPKHPPRCKVIKLMKTKYKKKK